MSVYSFGKLIGDNEKEIREYLENLARNSGVKLTIGLDDSEDERIFNESQLLNRQGLVFNVFSPNDSDIGVLHREARETGWTAIRKTLGDESIPHLWEQIRARVLPDTVYEAVSSTRLGKFVTGMFTINGATYSSLAIFDNGVEKTIEDSPERCLLLLLKCLLVPWDCGPNTLFVWKNPPNHALRLN